MIKPRHIEKFWNTLLAGNGSANHYTLGREIFGGSWKRAWVEEIVQAPALAGLVTTTHERVKLSGKIPLRYTLTPRGWELARTWKLLPAQGDLPPEELRRQFERLTAAMNPWAEEITRLANYGRRKLEEVPPPAKKKRYRSPAQIEKRKQWVANKVAERARLESLAAGQPAQPAAPSQPRTPSWASPQPTAPRVDPGLPVAPASPYRGAQSWMNDIGFVSSPVPRSAPPPDENAKLIARIKAAGYQVNDRGEVRYDNRWISLLDWCRLMPGALG